MNTKGTLIEKTELHKNIANMKVSELQEILHKSAWNEESKIELLIFEKILKQMNLVANMYEIATSEEGLYATCKSYMVLSEGKKNI